MLRFSLINPIFYAIIIANMGIEQLSFEFNNPVGKRLIPALSMPIEPTGFYDKLCACGCGKEVKIGKLSGLPNRYILGHSMQGRHHSEKTLKKFSDGSRKDENNPMYGKTGEKSPNFGKHPSEKTKRKISQANSNPSNETRKRKSISKSGKNNPNWGKHPSNETTMKHMESAKKSGVGKWMVGRHPSKLTREKMSIIMRTKWINGELSLNRKFQDTIPELLLDDNLIKIGYIMNITLIKQKRIKGIGLIDRYLPKENILIFVDGDYWHGNPKFYKANNIMYRGLKAKDIQKKDRIITKRCKQLGYKVLRLWEDDIKNNINECLDKIRKYENSHLWL